MTERSDLHKYSIFNIQSSILDRVKDDISSIIKDDALDSDFVPGELFSCYYDLSAHMRYDIRVMFADGVKSMPRGVGR